MTKKTTTAAKNMRRTFAAEPSFFARIDAVADRASDPPETFSSLCRLGIEKVLAERERRTRKTG